MQYLALALAATSTITQDLQAVVDDLSRQFNVSYSFAFKRGDEEVAVASGWASHEAGKEYRATTASLFPAGSVTKTFMAVTMLQLAEAGRVDLDRSIASYVDPWNAAQTPPVPSLFTQFGANKTAAAFANATVRDLMSMQTGLRDYSSSTLRKWTKAHPDNDLLPQSYVDSVSKVLYFQPRHGAAYSSDGYVVLGLVLAAVQGASDWSTMNQSSAIDLSHVPSMRHGNSSFIFMGKGKCSLHAKAGVVHQYSLVDSHYSNEYSYDAEKQLLEASARRSLGLDKRDGGYGKYDVCSMTHWTANYNISGEAGDATPAVVNATSAAKCCAAAKACNDESTGKPKCAYWSFDESAAQKCVVFASLTGATPTVNVTVGSATAPAPSPRLNASDVYDLFDESCLNGWTMVCCFPPPLPPPLPPFPLAYDDPLVFKLRSVRRRTLHFHADQT